MEMRLFKHRRLAMGIVLAMVSSSAPLALEVTSPDKAYFNNNFYNDLKGSLEGYVMFAQHSIIPAKQHIDGDVQPHLTAERDTLVMMKLSESDRDTAERVFMAVADENNKIIKQFAMFPPASLPKIAGSEYGADLDINDFVAPTEFDATVYDQAALNDLEDASQFLSLLQKNPRVKIETGDSRWIRTFNLPVDKSLEGRTLVFHSNAGYNSTIIYGERSEPLQRGTTLVFRFENGQWASENDAKIGNIGYGEFWSRKIPAALVKPGMRIYFATNGKYSVLKDVEIGAPTELLLNTIDVGMLTPNRGQFEMQKNPELVRQYFQTIPVSKLIVNEFTPLYLTEIMMPDGTFLTDYAQDTGTVHQGSMRQAIGKQLFSLGINNANYGIHSTAPGEKNHPYAAAQITAHNTIGRYENGVVVHGLSGGGGIVTLMNSTGNEFSHELGHNYGLGHYPKGFDGSVHRQADQINSTWGWDADNNFWLPNFGRNQSYDDTCLDDVCQSPFNGYAFNRDAMAGGSPYNSAFNQYTLHTPYSAATIQRFLENKAVFDSSSPTGYSKWNATSGEMEPWTLMVSPSRVTLNASPYQVSEDGLSSLLDASDVVLINFYDGSWTRDIYVPEANEENAGKLIKINHQATFYSNLHINGSSLRLDGGKALLFRSDGESWVSLDEEPAVQDVARIPQKEGVATTTLLGFYDPENKLTSYIYPATHGAYGMVFEPDNGDDRCQLNVETTEAGVISYALSSRRLSKDSMNQFNVNIERALDPVQAEIVCDDQVLATRVIDPPAYIPSVTIKEAASLKH